ncbi:MAG: o-succinylbenzoate synthase, partial [Actinomycetota bacterium]
MRIEEIELRRVSMRMKAPFRTSFGTTQDREIGLVTVRGDGAKGAGEIVAAEEPLYNEETLDTAFHMIERHLAPRVLGVELSHPSELVARWRAVRRNHMAKAGLETAAWDLWTAREGHALWKALGGVRQRVPAGVSVGIQEDVTALLEHIER